MKRHRGLAVNLRTRRGGKARTVYMLTPWAWPTVDEIHELTMRNWCAPMHERLDRILDGERSYGGIARGRASTIPRDACIRATDVRNVPERSQSARGPWGHPRPSRPQADGRVDAGSRRSISPSASTTLVRVLEDGMRSGFIEAPCWSDEQRAIFRAHLAQSFSDALDVQMAPRALRDNEHATGEARVMFWTLWNEARQGWIEELTMTETEIARARLLYDSMSTSDLENYRLALMLDLTAAVTHRTVEFCQTRIRLIDELLYARTRRDDVSRD